MAAQASFAPLETVSKVEVSVRCTNLKDMDVFSKSDPVVFLYERASPTAPWSKLGRTEVIDNNLNPKFSKTFLLDYRFEEVQYLKFSVFDVDNKHNVDNISLHDFIGEMVCTLADIVTAGQQYNKNLRAKGVRASRGQIFLMAEEVQDSKFNIQLQLSASGLDKKDFFGKSDPFLEIAKSQESGGYTVVYRSKPVMKNLNPRWPVFELTIQKLCSGDWDRSLKLSVWDWNRSGSHDIIGSCFTTLREICPERGGQLYNLELINEELKKKKKKYKSSGILKLEVVKAIPTFTFVDYIRGGCQISLMVAIDFTASNGKPQQPNSLHYVGYGQTGPDNEYIQAIKSVGSVLAPYDSDQLIPVFGFGARLPPNGEVSHCFPLNFSPQKPDVFGVEGILEAYHYALRQVELFGPTNFSYFLDKAIQYASESSVTQAQQNYTILLVITDGIISDMTRTVDKVVAASRLPLSIVIVGVGGADFTNMEVLDADNTPLVSQQGVKMSRDIVQFVPLRQFRSRSGANFSLTRETLAEIPLQLTSYMRNVGIKPNPPPFRQRLDTATQQSPAPLESAVPPLQQSYPPSQQVHPRNAPMQSSYPLNQTGAQAYSVHPSGQQSYPQAPPPAYSSLGSGAPYPY